MTDTGTPAAGVDLDAAALALALRTRTTADVRFDAGSRHLYATDASNYRHVPIGVVAPRTTADLIEVVRVCTEHGAPITTRGAGTSLAGQTANVAVIVDCSRHLDRILELDPVARTARVEPGVVLDDLRNAAGRHGLTFGPDPSTHDRCTLGGMIGNNACGVHSISAGRTVDNVLEMDVLLGDGTRMTVGRRSLADVAALAREPGRVGEIHRGLLDLRARYGDLVRARFPDIPRRVSGYNLDELLHDDAIDTARALVGTEGTCAVVLEATLRLVPSPPVRTMVVLGYDDLFRAGDDVPRLLAAGPLGLEGIDDQVVAGAQARGASRGADLLPPGRGWLMAEFGGDDRAAATASAERFVASLDADGPTPVILHEPGDQRAVWELRSSGLGAVTYVPGRRPKWPGWEDAAVPPARTGDYLRDLHALLDEFGLEAAVYGHFGDGCVHTKISFDHTTPEGIATFRRFVERAADLVLALGGSVSGEHGDGQARAELYERMFGPELVEAFRGFKALWDPAGLLNPGRIVDPLPLDASLRMADRRRMWSPATFFTFPDDAGDLGNAAARCVGVGACRRDHGTGTMCPSWMATHEEQHSTRGRARLLFEMLQPDTELDGWRDEAVADALDLCLSCKGCVDECPVDVDMATYKAEFNAHHWHRRVRPAAHYSLGLIRWWSAAATRSPRVTNALLRSPLAIPLKRLAGVTTERPVPAFAEESLTTWFRRRGGTHGTGDEVLLLPDTFTDRLDPTAGRAAVELLEHLGHRVVLPERPVCCGRPLYDVGMLATARRQLTTLVGTLLPHVRRGVPIVGLEPSCVAALRDELPNLLGVRGPAGEVAGASLTLAEFLVDVADWSPPRIDRDAVVHGHCHHKAVMGMTADARLLDATGLRWRELDAGCCGLAGSFGFEAGEKAALSVAIGEDRLLPAVRAADPGTLLLVDGFSCRTQIAHLHGDRSPIHLAELLLAAVRGEEPGDRSPAGGSDDGLAVRSRRRRRRALPSRSGNATDDPAGSTR
ncbi:MAG: FAD-binding oxidoreductase [Actinobacteria bacterium]|nr:FAD-binding oxidoreductase [Actinomycetota bacterium]